jgi:hypothetical protein
MTITPEVRILRALSGAVRAQRDLDQLAVELEDHQLTVATEVAAELAYQTRRLAYLARLRGVSHDDIQSACR